MLREEADLGLLRNLHDGGVANAPLDRDGKEALDDVDKSLHEMAKLSMTAHLIKLHQENRAVKHEADDTWQMLEI